MYGQKQAGRVWNKHLTDGLRRRGYKPCAIDECVWFKGKTVFAFYVDDGIFAGPDAAEIDKLIAELRKRQKGEEKGFKVTDEGDLSDYLGVKITKHKNGTISLTQPQLIDSILKDLGINDRTKGRITPAAGPIQRHPQQGL